MLSSAITLMTQSSWGNLNLSVWRHLVAVAVVDCPHRMVLMGVSCSPFFLPPVSCRSRANASNHKKKASVRWWTNRVDKLNVWKEANDILCAARHPRSGCCANIWFRLNMDWFNGFSLDSFSCACISVNVSMLWHAESGRNWDVLSQFDADCGWTIWRLKGSFDDPWLAVE